MRILSPTLIISEEEVIILVNPYEQRLFQIGILINAYKKAEDEYPEEIRQLQKERQQILEDIQFMEA